MTSKPPQPPLPPLPTQPPYHPTKFTHQDHPPSLPTRFYLMIVDLRLVSMLNLVLLVSLFSLPRWRGFGRQEVNKVAEARKSYIKQFLDQLFDTNIHPRYSDEKNHPCIIENSKPVEQASVIFPIAAWMFVKIDSLTHSRIPTLLPYSP